MTALPGSVRAPLAPALRLLGFAALLAVAAAVLPWNGDAFASWPDFMAACNRLRTYFAEFASPDLSAARLSQCATLAAQTLSVAALGVALALVLAYPLALGSCRALVLGDDKHSGLGGFAARVLLQGCRLLLDVMRGVPDLLWAIVFVNLTGANAITGVLALGISVAGILGKVLSEQWDNVDPERWAALRSTGASRLQVFFTGIQPLAARSTQSFVLMRAECAVRNASVIGVVGAGGLGTGLWDAYQDMNWSGVATVLLTLLLVTMLADLAANLLRRQLRVDPNHPRAARATSVRASTVRRAGVAVLLAAAVGAAVIDLLPEFDRAFAELSRIEWPFVREFTANLAMPMVSWEVLRSVLHHAVVPLALALLATTVAALAAAAAAYPGSIAFGVEAHRFTGERPTRAVGFVRALLVATTRLCGLVLRGVPEVAWVLVLSVFFRPGLDACVLAVAIHSAGVLVRVFVETVDNLPYRTLEHAGLPRRRDTFVYAALPRAWPDWRSYTMFQFEVNLRVGLALGVVGAGGLGDRFDSAFKHPDYSVLASGGNPYALASSYLWAMVLLTVVVDRLSRRLQRGRSRRC